MFLPSTITKGKRKLLEESDDEELLTVPDVDSIKAEEATKRRRGVDQEQCRRLKRLLRNRVQAQQAQERKKVYVNDMESKANELHEKILKLEEKISTLVNENIMLRKILMNTRIKVDENEEVKRSSLQQLTSLKRVIVNQD